MFFPAPSFSPRSSKWALMWGTSEHGWTRPAVKNIKQQILNNQSVTGPQPCGRSAIKAEFGWSRGGAAGSLRLLFLSFPSVSGGLRRKQAGLDNCSIVLLSLSSRSVSGSSDFSFCVNNTDPVFLSGRKITRNYILFCWQVSRIMFSFPKQEFFFSSGLKNEKMYCNSQLFLPLVVAAPWANTHN